VARLFGLHPAPAAGAAVLELGCGDGGNALSIAQTLPGARVVGLDASESAIARGVTLAEAAGLGNVQLRPADIEALPEDVGRFDYIVAHGVYSWIPARVRVALLAAVRRLLQPNGIAFVSYNAYPGSYLRDMARDILHYHLRDVSDPQQRIDGAQELMAAVVSIEDPSPFARVLREHLGRMLQYPAALLVHDDLAEISTPFYLHEFVDHAEKHGLAFLADADLGESLIRGVSEGVVALMEKLPDDVVVRDQYLDFFKNRMFHCTLLCQGELSVDRTLDRDVVTGCAISSTARPEGEDGFVTRDGLSMTTSEPHVHAAMTALVDAWPGALDYASLLGHAVAGAGEGVAWPLVDARLREVLLEAYLAGIVRLAGCPAPLVAQAGERPLASPLARAQIAAGSTIVTSLGHETVSLDGPFDARLLALLDGTRDRTALAAALPDLEVPIDDALAVLVNAALLSA
jgi:SAM-dependent methyltransferase